ncbi:zinc finger protein 729 [Papilio machaon]|uniref:zinc finger protein 729 n=1 Tax=Papilio machaon TaxID=76193 RepID=UPI001E663396|nr:zinc finger protein 729 [Papilio machaon]
MEDVTEDKSHIHQARVICICCLSTTVPLIKLLNCKHLLSFAKIIDNKFQVEFKDAYACYLCHNLIKKIDKFKQQVEESISNLYEVHKKLIIEPKKLQITDIEINSAINNEPLKNEFNQIVNIKTEITEIKYEEDLTDYDIPLKVKKVKSKEKKVKGTKRGPNYEGKLKIVLLTYEEMMEERKKESAKISYINLPFKCEDCVIGFDHEVTLKMHIIQRHSNKEKGYICDICNSVLSTEASLKEHKKRHIRRYECLECGLRKADLHYVIKHYKEEHGSIHTMHTCVDCGFTTESNRTYRYHREKHRSKKKCRQCGNTFANPSALRTHVFTVHSKSGRTYICPVCGKTYRAKSSLVAHQTLHATGPSPDSFCVSCKIHFRNAVALKHHLKTHSKHVRDSDKKFTCEECGLKFLLKRLLEEHIDWEHLKREKYVCEECTKVFKNKSALKRHKSYVHDKKRPPKNKICDHCGQGFTTLQILRTHVRTHTGERPLQCTKCPATFAHNGALYTHNKLLHTNK